MRRTTLKRFGRILLTLWSMGSMVSSSLAAEGQGGAIAWQPWSQEVFAAAKREHRLVILDLEAVWCHWCHVMDRETYANPAVIAAIQKNFLPVRVDQDAAPDLANRYRDYGWPATLVFDATGKELAKRAGFIPPGEMASLLEKLVKDPASVAVEAEPQIYSAQGALTPELRSELEKRHREAFDPELGGLKLQHKYLEADSLEYTLRRAAAGDAGEAERAKLTLRRAIVLLDPAWGGVYQYSHGGDWEHPHFEKILSMQRDYLRIYSLAYAQWGDPEYLRMTRGIVAYLKNFLRSPQGAFYTSQDADLVPGEHSAEYFRAGDAERRAQGMPRIDKHSYARENGWAIEALALDARAANDPEALDMAKVAARWVQGHRGLARNNYEAARWIAREGTSPVGGFGHGEGDAGGWYLGDTLAMARAFLALYQATGEREWLRAAQDSADFMSRRFRDSKGAGFITAVAGGPLPPTASVEENIAAARFYNLLSHYTGNTVYRADAEAAMRYLATPAVATQNLTEAGILLADEELRGAPTHVTVVGGKDDAPAGGLFRSAAGLPTDYLRIEWWDRREGPMPNPDVQYPALERSAAFVCSQGLCSSPVFDPGEIRGRVDRLRAKIAKPS